MTLTLTFFRIKTSNRDIIALISNVQFNVGELIRKQGGEVHVCMCVYTYILIVKTHTNTHTHTNAHARTIRKEWGVYIFCCGCCATSMSSLAWFEVWGGYDE